ncbi:hypothetical protein VNO77_07321 [Canavalia gladiata]|uniref:Uncharacterized protein n=1 Tax=Canavalia gladiata TaxID=3824 RepID=A0AAN9ME73_CANGL
MMQSIWEKATITELFGVTKDTRMGGPLEGAHVHIVHLSDSRASLDLIKIVMTVILLYIYPQEAKGRGDSLSVETCSHYLAFSSEEIPNGDTLFKCSPPIRDAFNKEIMGVPELKLLEEGDFSRAWGGISSLHQECITVVPPFTYR